MTIQDYCFIKIIPIRVFGPIKYIDTYALLDEGSTITLIDYNLDCEIDVWGEKLMLSLKGINDAVAVARESEKINAVVTRGEEKCEISGAVTVNNIQFPLQFIPKELVDFVAEEVNSMKMDIKLYESAHVKVLIGQDNWRLNTSREILEMENSNLAFSRTELGWVLHGDSKTNEKQTHSAFNICGPQVDIQALEWGCDKESIKSRADDKALDELVKEYFQLDSLEIINKIKHKNEHERAMKMLKATLSASEITGKWSFGSMIRRRIRTGCRSRVKSSNYLNEN